MEPVESKVTYVFRLPVAKVEERFEYQYISGVGKDAQTEPISLGWFVVTNQIAFCVGATKPDLSPNDMLRLTITKA